MPDTLQFAAGSTNVKVGERADVVILFGPDTSDKLQKEHDEILAYCKSNHLKYVILGNGKNPVLREDIAKLPKANYGILSGHGMVSKNSNNEPAHFINVTGQRDNSLDLLAEVQQQTDTTKFLCCSCYAGKINDDIKNNDKIKVGTEMVATSPPDDVAAIQYSITSIKNLLVNIAHSQHKKVPMSGFFGKLLKACPETMTYGIQLENGFQTFTVRRQDRAALGEGDPQKYFEHNKKRLSEFLRANHLPVYKLPKMTEAEALNYRQTTFLHHLWHCDADVVEKLIKIDPNIISVLPYSPLNFALRNHLMRRSREEIKKMLSILILYDPEGLALYMQSASRLRPHNAARYHSVKSILYEIANETQSAHVIRELCGGVQNELITSMQNLAAAQAQLHQRQFIQDPVYLQQRQTEAELLLQHANWLSQQSLWIYSQSQHLTPAQIQIAAQQLPLANDILRVGQQLRDQSQLDICLQQLQLGMNLTNHGLQQCLAGTQQNCSHMTKQQYNEYLQTLYMQALALLNQTHLDLEHANYFSASQVEISQGGYVMPNHAVRLQEQALAQAELAIELRDMIMMSLQLNEQEMIARSTENSRPPTKTELIKEADRLEKLVQLDLKNLNIMIENINKFSANHDIENVTRNRKSVDKRIKEIMSHLIKLQLLGSANIDKFTNRLNELTQKLKESQNENLNRRQGFNK